MTPDDVEGRGVTDGAEGERVDVQAASVFDASISMLELRDSGREKIELRLIKPLAFALCMS